MTSPRIQAAIARSRQFREVSEHFIAGVEAATARIEDDLTDEAFASAVLDELRRYVDTLPMPEFETIDLYDESACEEAAAPCDGCGLPEPDQNPYCFCKQNGKAAAPKFEGKSSDAVWADEWSSQVDAAIRSIADEDAAPSEHALDAMRYDLASSRDCNASIIKGMVKPGTATFARTHQEVATAYASGYSDGMKMNEPRAGKIADRALRRITGA